MTKDFLKYARRLAQLKSARQYRRFKRRLKETERIENSIFYRAKKRGGRTRRVECILSS